MFKAHVFCCSKGVLFEGVYDDAEEAGSEWFLTQEMYYSWEISFNKLNNILKMHEKLPTEFRAWLLLMLGILGTSTVAYECGVEDCVCSSCLEFDEVEKEMDEEMDDSSRSSWWEQDKLKHAAHVRLCQDYLSQSAHLGNAEAMVRMSGVVGNQRSLHSFWGTDDHTLKFAWMEKAAKLGCADAMYKTAVMLHRGEGVNKSVSKARLWLLEAVEQKHADSTTKLAELDEELVRQERATQAAADLIAAQALQARMRMQDY